mmetsp:Transcript_5791/g.17107  ORF Transcript_5791/g.17107 Transcript_5791/m.17107 type:complete len:295 (+) Transcript_5791:1135-2019(+)
MRPTDSARFGSPSPTSARGTPSTHSVTSTRRPEPRTCGTTTPATDRMFSRKRVCRRPSARRSTSSHRAAARPSRRRRQSTSDFGSRRGAQVSRTSAARSRTQRSTATRSTTPGLTTLTAASLSLPSAPCHVARCTWAMEAEAAGSGRTSTTLPPSSSAARIRSGIASPGIGCTPAWSSASSLAQAGPRMSSRTERSCPTFTKAGPRRSSASRTDRAKAASSRRSWPRAQRSAARSCSGPASAANAAARRASSPGRRSRYFSNVARSKSNGQSSAAAGARRVASTAARHVRRRDA